MIGERYKANPFLQDMVIKKKGKYVKLSRLGRDNTVLINNETGEHFGTHVTTVKQVDDEQFIKLFTANVALTFELNSPGIKAFTVLLWSVQRNALAKDEVPLDSLIFEEFIEAHQTVKMSVATFLRGLSELVRAQIIAKTMRRGWYYINPNFIFNGDRIAFTTLIERKKSEIRDTKTIDMFE